MMLKPWYTIVTPREDLREGKPLDASEFAVHLDQVRDGRAPEDYQKPERFFEHTYLTQNLTALAAEVIRRLSGIKVETSPVFNLATQFGGGKTHALTLLYHLAKNGAAAKKWSGVNKILNKAGVREIPQAAVATFVGTEFDSIVGRGGHDGTPVRKTPWGEIAFQLGGDKSFALVAEHDKKMIAPAGDVIRRLLPQDKPCLILLDELMNYVSRNRRSGLSTQLYDFLQNLSETARGENNVVLAVSIPASELEMTAEDQSDYDRFKKLLDRLGKAVFMSAETETAEIIRRRLFEWNGLPEEAKKVVTEYADWVIDHRQQIPNWFPIDNAREAFAATYPLHPMVISVFERKWRALPRFQQTRGILRLLALWVSEAFLQGYKGDHRDSLIGLGTAPLDHSLFRAAVFEQLGENRLEGVVTTDICGKQDSHTVRLDKTAVDTIKKARLHQKIATTIFFESNGGQLRAEATPPEIRLAVAEPDLDIGNVETVLETLGTTCYFLSVERNKYRFSLSPNLNKILADRRASIQSTQIDERVRDEVRKVFDMDKSIDRRYFPEKSNQIPNQTALTLVVLPPDQSMQDKQTLPMIEAMTREYGSSNRTFKSALIWAVADSDTALREEARKVMAWEAIKDERDELNIDEKQKPQIEENLNKAKRDLKECVWRSYKNIALLGKDNTLRVIDLGLVHSSAATSIVNLIISRLRQEGDIEESISPNFLVRNWPPVFKEWSTKSVREAFYASPQFPRLLKPESMRETICKGVENGLLAYVGKSYGGAYEPFYYNCTLRPEEVEISDDMFIITKETAESYLVVRKTKIDTGEFPKPSTPQDFIGIKDQVTPTIKSADTPTIPVSTAPTSPQSYPGIAASKISWSGEVPTQKWMNFYTKVLSRFSVGKGLKLNVSVEVSPESGISKQQIEETKVALRELGLNDHVDTVE